MKRKIVGQKLADQLFLAERAIDTALRETAQLTVMLPDARLEARLSAVVGQSVFDGASSAIAQLTQARRAIVETHNGLAEVRDQIGLGAVAFGPVDKPDENPPREGGRPVVRLAG